MLYWVTGAVLLVYLVLVWFFAGWMNPPGSGMWVLRIGLWLLGLVGASFTVWWFRRQAVSKGDSDPDGPASSATNEVDLLVRDAVRKLKSSPIGRGASLRNLPLIFLVGDPGSAKTTTILHSALDPELLAGHVYQDSTVVPTRVANFWYTRQAVFVDGGGGLFSQPYLWRRLIKLVQPGRVASAGKQQQAPRAAIVCFDSESFLRQGASEATLSSARRLGTRLLDISQLLGISFPIYVVFTRADRIGARPDGGSSFFDYVAGLTKDEASQVLGVTLPVRSLQASGVYADEETRRLEKAFDELFYSLAEKRIDLLFTTGQQEKRPGIYEFPRELRKLRKVLVQFLVDLGRPSQLNVNPFLRGFYFSGVRPGVIEDIAAPVELQAPDTSYNANATVIFGAGGMRAPEPVAAQRIRGTREVPEWVFLSQLFNEVILKDRVALSASGFSSRVSLLRRVALASLIGVALIFALGFLISFIGNFFLERGVKQAVEDVRAIHTTSGQTPTTDQLRTLDKLRKELEPLSAYYNHTAGVPWSLRWWMYSGDDIYLDARQVYFEQFRNLLFADTQAKLLASFPPKDKPGPGDSYEAAYSPLKAYLITTAHPEKSTQDFLPSILYNTWAAGKNPDDQIAPLAREQFNFYSAELPFFNPYPSAVNAKVRNAQDYLHGFNDVERNYHRLMDKAHTADNPDISFSNVFPSGANVIISHDVVRAAFTHDGFGLVQTALIARPNQASEDWVLGPDSTGTSLDPVSLNQALKQRYHDEFVKAWTRVLSGARVNISSSSPKEAAKTLDILTGTNSPILEFLWFISHNTNVADQDISAVFAPVQSVEPPGPEKGSPSQYKIAANAAYTDALSDLRGKLNLLAPTSAPGDTHFSDDARVAVEKAEASAVQVAGNDAKYGISDALANLLKQPINAAENSIGSAGAIGANGAGKTFCSQVDQLKRSFPFNPGGSDLGIDVLNATFAPTTNSALQVLLSKLSPQYLIKNGTSYEPTDPSKVSKDFLASLRRMTALSNALYQGGSLTPKVEYSLKQVASNVDGLALKIGPSELSDAGQLKMFTWIGSSEEVTATQKGVDIGVNRSGPWAIFHFIADGQPSAKGPGSYELRFAKQSNGQVLTAGGKQQTYSYELHFTNGDPWAEFTSLRCVSQVTR